MKKYADHVSTLDIFSGELDSYLKAEVTINFLCLSKTKRMKERFVVLDFGDIQDILTTLETVLNGGDST